MIKLLKYVIIYFGVFSVFEIYSMWQNNVNI